MLKVTKYLGLTVTIVGTLSGFYLMPENGKDGTLIEKLSQGFSIWTECAKVDIGAKYMPKWSIAPFIINNLIFG